nr:basic proline-rich protein-like [Aegilops tauschii subsp. strangulata]
MAAATELPATSLRIHRHRSLVLDLSTEPWDDGHATTSSPLSSSPPLPGDRRRSIRAVQCFPGLALDSVRTLVLRGTSFSWPSSHSPAPKDRRAPAAAQMLVGVASSIPTNSHSHRWMRRIPKVPPGGTIFAITAAASRRLSSSARGLDFDPPPERPRAPSRSAAPPSSCFRPSPHPVGGPASPSRSSSTRGRIPALAWSSASTTPRACCYGPLCQTPRCARPTVLRQRRRPSPAPALLPARRPALAGLSAPRPSASRRPGHRLLPQPGCTGSGRLRYRLLAASGCAPLRLPPQARPTTTPGRLRRLLARAPVVVCPCDATCGVSSAGDSRAGRPLAPPTGLAPLGRLPRWPAPLPPCARPRPDYARACSTSSPAVSGSLVLPRARPGPASVALSHPSPHQPAPGPRRVAPTFGRVPRTRRLRVLAESPPARSHVGSRPVRLAPPPPAGRAAPGRLRPARAWCLPLRRPPAPPPPVAGSRVPAPPANPVTRRLAGSACQPGDPALGQLRLVYRLPPAAAPPVSPASGRLPVAAPGPPCRLTTPAPAPSVAHPVAGFAPGRARVVPAPGGLPLSPAAPAPAPAAPLAAACCCVPLLSPAGGRPAGQRKLAG